MAESSELKLIGRWSSPFVTRVKISLNVKSLKYVNHEEDMNPKSDLLLKSNPVYKKIPVLLHNDKPICESLIIVQYIDENWSSGTSILPADPYDRAIARFWAAYMDDKWFPSLKNIMVVEEAEEKKSYIQQLDEAAVNLEEAFLSCSKGKDFFGGDRIGYLDIAFGSFLGWLSAVEKMYGFKVFDETKTPALLKWTERFLADDAVKGIIPETDKLIELAHSLIAKWRGLIPK